MAPLVVLFGFGWSGDFSSELWRMSLQRHNSDLCIVEKRPPRHDVRHDERMPWVFGGATSSKLLEALA
jgi:hypothetical protein